jgi:hypothetical protein
MPLTAGPALHDALAGPSDAVRFVALLMLWIGWGATLVALLVRSTVSLTVLRTLMPAAPVVCVIASFAGASTFAAVVAVMVSLAATATAFTAEVGEAYVQGSAYGDERRLLLKPAAPLYVMLPISWTVMVTTAVAGPLWLAARAWIAGIVLVAVAVPLCVMLGRRYHRLTKRWLVFVPAGLVLHDPLTLADTAMFPRRQVEGLVLAPATTEALDLTAGAPGLAVEVRLRDPGMVVLAGTWRYRQGRGVHVRSFLCSPSRPGRALEAAEERHLRLP